MYKVLAVDDDPELRRLMRVTLELAGFEVEMAEDGDDALAKIREFQPDLVVLDIMMPKRDGWSVIETMKRDVEWRGIPVVFLSARTLPADMHRARDLGAAAFVTKPFDPIELADLVGVLTPRRSA